MNGALNGDMNGGVEGDHQINDEEEMLELEIEEREEGTGNDDDDDDLTMFKNATRLITRLNSISDGNPLNSPTEGRAASDLLKLVVGRYAGYVGKLNASKGDSNDLRERLRTLTMENSNLKDELTSVQTQYSGQSETADLSIQLQYFQNELQQELQRRIKAELKLAKLNSSAETSTAAGENYCQNSAEGGNSAEEIEDPLLPLVDEPFLPPPSSTTRRPPPIRTSTVTRIIDSPPHRPNRSPPPPSVSPPPPSLDHYPINTKKLLEIKAGVSNHNGGGNGFLAGNSNSNSQQNFYDDLNFELLRPPAPPSYSPVMGNNEGRNSQNDDNSSIFGGTVSSIGETEDDERNDPSYLPSRSYPPPPKRSFRTMFSSRAKVAYPGKRRVSSPQPSTSRQALLQDLLDEEENDEEEEEQLEETSSPATPNANDSPEKNSLCPICSRGYINKYHVQRHILHAHDRSKKFACTIPSCRQRFARMGLLISHKNREHSASGRKKICEICDRAFLSFSSLLKHQMNLHNPERRRSFACSVCSKSFFSSRDLTQHLRIHKIKPWSCKYCDKNYKTEEQLNLHLKLHKSEKLKFICFVCGEAFQRPSQRAAHMRKHTGKEKPFNEGTKEFHCGVCSRGFVHKQAWRKHVKIMHVRNSSELEREERSGEGGNGGGDGGNRIIPPDSQVKPWECSECDMSFKTQSALKAHSVCHSNEKPFNCEEINCGKAFKRKYEWVLHQRVHSGERPFQCKFCKKKLATSSQLRVHVNLHTKEKSYDCRICGKSFSQNSNARIHERNIHGYHNPMR